MSNNTSISSACVMARQIGYLVGHRDVRFSGGRDAGERRGNGGTQEAAIRARADGRRRGDTNKGDRHILHYFQLI